MSLPDTLLINGTDLRSIPGLIIGDLSGLLQEGPWRGDNETIPGMPGEIGTIKVRDAYNFDVPVALVGTSRLAFLQILDQVRALCPTNLNTLTRRLTASVGTVEDECTGDYAAGAAVAALSYRHVRTVLTFRNLDGGWS